MSAVGSVEFQQTSYRGHASALSRAAMRAGVDVVVALGGDGTVNEVVNGLLSDGVHADVPTLGIVAAGSTNVFARALGMPNDPIASIGVLGDALAERRVRAVSLGQADDRWFVFAAGLGFDAAVTAAVERQRRRGRRSTHRLYVRTALRQYGSAVRARPAIRLERLDGSAVAGLHFVAVSNASPWTYLGRHPLTPSPLATLDNGLAVYARRSMAPVSTLWGLAQLFVPDTIPAGRGVLVEHDLSELVLRAEPAAPFQLDGEYLGTRTRVRFRAILRALSVLA